jgi:NADPH-dependent F420 reductase
MCAEIAAVDAPEVELPAGLLRALAGPLSLLQPFILAPIPLSMLRLAGYYFYYSNQKAVDDADIVILAIPYKHLIGTLETLNGFEGKIVISPVNPMEKRDFFTCVPPPEGSAALLIKKLLPPTARICTAFNTIAANRWKLLDEELSYSVPVCGDDDAAKQQVMGMVNRISKLQAFDAGPLAASHLVECLTPLLLNIARYNKMKDVGIQFR